MDKTEVTITLTVDKKEDFASSQIRSREVIETTVGLEEPDAQRIKKFQKFADKMRRALNISAVA